MENKLKAALKWFVPSRVRTLALRSIPKIRGIDTYVLEQPELISDLVAIDDDLIIREIGPDDSEQLKTMYTVNGNDNVYKSKIVPRLSSAKYTGLGVFDSKTGRIVYLSWVVGRSIPYFEEFGITMGEGDFLVKDIFVVPEYRHKGISSRMEQERINYCVRRSASRIFTQPLSANSKAGKVYPNLGYRKIREDLLIQWPVFSVWREFYSFLKNPFRKVVN